MWFIFSRGCFRFIIISRAVLLPGVPKLLTEDLANKSTSLLSLSVECAFTQLHLISKVFDRLSNSVQSSLFLTSFLFAVFQPFFFQLCIHSVIPDFTYLESVNI